MKMNSLRFKTTLFVFSLALCFSNNLLAQPANDDCVDAISVPVGASEGTCIPVAGTTVDGTPSVDPTNVCSGSWFGDDIWFSFTTAATLPTVGIEIKSQFGNESGDVPSVGMAVYADCGADENPIRCFSSTDPNMNSIFLYNCDLDIDHTYYVRVWSTPDPNTNAGTLRLCVFEGNGSSDNVLWGGNSGEGDFDGGLNDWTTIDDNACPNFELWRWNPIGVATDGAFSTGAGVSEAPTACNGAMTFDSDFFDNNGDPNNLGGGDCPAVQIGELISPTIDLAAISSGIGGVSLKFHQATRQFQSGYIVSYSNDDGAIWNDININLDFPVNSPVINEFETVFLPGADLNSSTFKIKFRYEGNYYYWIVDDVQLVEANAFDLAVFADNIAIAPNAMTPVSQVEPYSHLANVFNLGVLEQSDVNLNVSIINDNTSDQVFSDDLDLGTIPAFTQVVDQPFANYYTPNGFTPGTFTATYEVSSGNDDTDLSNNTQTYSSITTDTVFAKEFGATRSILPAAGNWQIGEAHSWAYGNYFYIVNGDNTDASSISFMIGNASDPGMAGRLLVAYLYRWDDDTNQDGDMDPDERTKVGYGIYEIMGSETNADLITVPLSVFPTNDPGPIDLESNQAYVAMLEYITNDQQDLVMMAGEIDYTDMINRSAMDGITATRYASLLGIGGVLDDEPYSTLGFGADLQPVVRLNIRSTSMIITSEVTNDTCDNVVGCSGSIDITTTGVEPFTYIWNEGSTTQDLVDVCAGIYTVIVTDGDGNTATVSATVDEVILIDVDLDYSIMACASPCEGSINLTVSGGAEPYTYEWFNGIGTMISTEEDLTGVCPDIYTVQVTDANGCMVEATPVSTLPDPLILESDFTQASCSGICDGSIDLTGSGGIPPYSYTWSGGLPATEDQDDLCSGNYMVTITDSDGCTNLLEIFVGDEDDLISTTSTNSSCFGTCTGNAVITVDGGTPPYTFEGDFEDLCPGSYTATITDANGCSTLSNYNIIESPEITLTIDALEDEMDGMMDGSVEITAGGGTPPYTYSWSDGTGVISTDEDPSGLSAGTYEVEITDADGCVIVFSDIILDNIVAVSNLELNNAISVFPNPSKGIIQVKFDLEDAALVIFELYDFTGRKVTSWEPGNVSNQIIPLDLSHFSDGVYTLKIKVDDVFIVEKIIKYSW